ncbi:MAG: S8 family serine peptidase [Proteobacteria bacterium]|nr:S8 family serine peptidase [Pseudomonadota bacterium]
MLIKGQLVRFLSGMSLVVSAISAQATTVAIIDSGVDYKHEALSGKIWTNPSSSTTDDAGTKYQDDTNGWNFAENNNQIIDYKYVGTFSQDCYKMVETQGKILRGIATDAEKAWYKSKKEDQTFLKEMQKFGNFIHGTHVSGITADESTAPKIVGLKLIPTETPGAKMVVPTDKAGNPLVSMMLGMVAKRQASLLIKVGKYTKAVQARVANGSFGTSVTAVKPVVAQLVKQITGADPTEAETEAYAKELVDSMIKECKGFPDASPNTLFVFAAGNDGTDNDVLPTSPANIKTENTIAVAATFGTEKLASFSNFGVKNVDVAAPGVVIRSSIPGGQYLELSGTSMAAPFVTNVATRIQEANPTLSPAGVKRILMETVDKKPWLAGKVRSGGIVNAGRAFAAAELSNTMRLDLAVKASLADVADEVGEDLGLSVDKEDDILVTPMPMFFQE